MYNETFHDHASQTEILATFTPGPWAWNHNGGPAFDGHRIFGDGICVGSASNDANARLIAAAPDLLEALIDLCESFKCHNENYDLHDGYNAARSAIYKATLAAH